MKKLYNFIFDHILIEVYEDSLEKAEVVANEIILDLQKAKEKDELEEKQKLKRKLKQKIPN